MVSFNQILRSVAIATAFVAVTNCSETATSPSSANSSTPSFNRSGPGGHGQSDRFLAGGASGSSVVPNFTLDGGSYIQFPNGSVCQIGVSGYGTSVWDATCQTNKGPVQISWTSSTTKSGHSRYDFNPPMRFVPGHTVMLYIYDPVAANNPNSVIVYCNDLNICVDEGKNDPSLVTGHNPATGYIFRRIKHFSGYATSVGGDCDPSDPTCGNQGSM